MKTRALQKALAIKEKLIHMAKDNRGQGSIETAIFCEPFFRLREVFG